ncbi:Asp-tRNA(Asn)/Glu-tRNA(Gln) amidotransferase A subunit family amidase [Ochrobactrum sp. 19YEA23]|nr:Asp-tRNA(Asn)/Glu-tRNA(Gln) amidotransferase A subunit family amidase [Ochrobactrum sp. 19YEA23]
MNGVTGLKPSWGRVSRAGIYELAGSLDHAGPITRNVVDAAAILGVISGHDPADLTSSRQPVPNYLAGITDSIKGLRIGFDMTFSSLGTDAEHIQALQTAADVLRELGAKLVEIKVPDTSQIIWDWFDICAVQNALVHGKVFDEAPYAIGQSLRELVARGRALKGTDYQKVISRRDIFRSEFDAVFAKVDLVISPAMAFSAPTLSMVQNFTDDLISGIHRFTCPFTMSGHPVLSMPGGSHSDGMPINIQLIGPPFGEDILLRAGHAFQLASAWHNRHPLTLEN